jgi:hypothetical protein
MKEITMNLNDGARVRNPRDAIEYRLGTVTDITYAPHSTYIQRIRLRFPTGEERTYPADEVAACSRTDDHAALVAALIDACRSVRDACGIAHDYDERLSTDLIRLLLTVHGVVASRLGVTLDPDSLDRPATTYTGDENQAPDTDLTLRTGGAVMTRTAATAMCASMYAADLVPAYAFVFRVAATEIRFTVYAHPQDHYHVGDEYTLLLVPRDAVPLPLTVEDAEFLRHCLDNAAHRWREAIIEADAEATQPHRSRPAEPGRINVEPTPAGNRAAARLFADELDRVQRLAGLLDRHLDRARAANPGEDQP